MTRSLDEYQRYLERQTQRQREAATESAAAATLAVADTENGRRKAADSRSGVPAEPPQNFRYELRGGITIAIPVKADASGGVSESAAQEARMWQRLPHHIQLLMQLADSEEEEAAQKYYSRGFKESRRQLIERLLDPTLTLEDTARVLGVVPATVRRYTNRGVLPHHRTVGQQRRFKLSDVLAFLEAQQSGKMADLDRMDDSDDAADTADEDETDDILETVVTPVGSATSVAVAETAVAVA